MIMLHKKNLKYGFAGLLVLLLAGCGEEIPEMLLATTDVTFRLELPASLEVDTRVANTLGDITVEDVWVVQYNASTNGFIKSMKFEGNAGTPGLNGNILTFSTSSADFSQLTSRFYVIVNAGTNFLDGFSGNEVALKAKTVAVSSGSITGELKLLTSGPITYTPVAGGKVMVVAPLSRAYAKVSVTWNDADTKGAFTISKMTVKNYPKYMALYTRGGGALGTSYPVTGDINAAASATIGNMNSGTPYTFYIPENLRGMGTATSFADKGLDMYGPGSTTGSKLGGCTYILLEGTYKYGDGATSEAIDVAYRIYLGGNLRTDYNIQRNYYYKVTLNLSGANSSDVRVQITDGKVVVFDEVEKVEHTVDFKD